MSVASVSRVLNNRADVSAITRERIRAIICKHGYNPFVASHKKVNIGIVICQENPVVEGFLGCILSGISRYSFDCDIFTTMLFVKSGSGESLAGMLRERRCGAGIIVFPQLLRASLDELGDSGIPSVLLNAEGASQSFVGISHDSYAGGRLAMKHLLELGHRRIAFLSGPTENCPDHINRRQAYIDAMKESGEKDFAKLLVEHIPTLCTLEAGLRQSHALLSGTRGVTAILANSDEMAYGAIAACDERGLSVPADISVMGFDDLSFSQYCLPPLSTVSQPMEQMGFAAAKTAVLMAKGGAREIPDIVFPAKLVARKSTSAPRGGKAWE